MIRARRSVLRFQTPLLLLGGALLAWGGYESQAGGGAPFRNAAPWRPFADECSDAFSIDHYLNESVGSLYGYQSLREASEAESLLYAKTSHLAESLPGMVQGTVSPATDIECVGPRLGEVKGGSAPTADDMTLGSQASRLLSDDNLLRMAENLGFDPEMFRGFLRDGVPYQPLYRALEYWTRNPDFVTNRKRMSLVDFTRHANEDRFWVLDLEKGKIQLQTKVAAGRGSDSRPRDGIVESCSNRDGTHQSSYGAMRIASGRYSASKNWGAKRPNNLVLEGGESGNSQCLQRGIIIHGASYCSDASCMGRSHGCFAIPLGQVSAIANDVAGGSLLYAYAPQCEGR